jgi:hypothetical protein
MVKKFSVLFIDALDSLLVRAFHLWLIKLDQRRQFLDIVHKNTNSNAYRKLHKIFRVWREYSVRRVQCRFIWQQHVHHKMEDRNYRVSFIGDSYYSAYLTKVFQAWRGWITKKKQDHAYELECKALLQKRMVKRHWNVWKEARIFRNLIRILISKDKANVTVQLLGSLYRRKLLASKLKRHFLAWKRWLVSKKSQTQKVSLLRKVSSKLLVQQAYNLWKRSYQGTVY